jgi:hypothetical protein
LGCLFQSPICTASAFVVRRGLLQARSVCRPCCQNCCQARLLRHATVTTSSYFAAQVRIPRIVEGPKAARCRHALARQSHSTTVALI